MTSQVEGQSVYVPPYAKGSGHETATTTSLTSVEAAKAELANANEKDIAMGTDEKDAAALHLDDKSEEVADDDEGDYLPMGPKLYLIFFSLMMAVFCVALDNTIIAVAIPRITDQFHNLNDVGWYGSAYLLTTCSFQLLFGKFYSMFNVKWVLLTGLAIFEIGSLVCALAPTSMALIIGRAVAGVGSAGIFTGALVVLAHTVRVERRPAFFSLIGAMYGIASVAGPLMGGAFTEKLTWRWCFYINLPIGAVTTVGLLAFLKLKKKAKRKEKSFWITFKHLDPLGTAIFVPAIICLLLALQWGGVIYEWGNGRIIALFVLFGLTIIVFIALQIYLKDDATVPARIASQRTIASSVLFGLCIGGSFFIYVYFIPIWFQAILGTSAIGAGVDSLPLILAQVFAIILSGGLVTYFGYFAPFFIASSVVMSIGAGLLTLLKVDSSKGAWVGFQFIYGLGVGLGFQQGGVAAQAVLKFSDVPIGTAVVLFVQVLGGAVFVGVAQNLFTTNLVKNLTALHIPNFDPSDVVHAGATNLRHMVPPERLPEVLVAYNAAIMKTFQLGLILSCLSILGAVGVEWKSLRAKPAAAPVEAAEKAELVKAPEVDTVV
ncbi:hypothetical protein VC83_08414 [Pseudogymnoascus destructans]|uniref:Major facilitator superfamily (MFS) profile domain-containing protein n=2 Tax=Pseudogymnoascus destructans TaxID=655981 RepID=L8FP02_PSED2|nr:uncharacterized protein VC83_08414 [Pseudogymnoascus destructans]ELR02715.1 hypothetical protein GMDG_05664 [Pseudogymnoascus destructans 20631-21]OAF55206.1 hypothetical protein VC83_08414 [Pseudogymnoascus destructans]